MSHQQKETEAIREQMLHVRSRMPYSMDVLRSETRQLLDWKYYVKQHPIATAVVVAGVAYYLVPKKSKPSTSRRSRRADEEQVEEAATKASLFSLAASFLGTLAARAATTYVTNRVQGYVMQSAPNKAYARKV